MLAVLACPVRGAELRPPLERDAPDQSHKNLPRSSAAPGRGGAAGSGRRSSAGLAPRSRLRNHPGLANASEARRDAEATRAKAASLGLSFPVVMQSQWEISLKYGMFATPIGYLIDEQGIILRDVAVGVGPILALAEEPALPPTEDVERLLLSQIEP